jgi:hypothetical protein
MEEISQAETLHNDPRLLEEPTAKPRLQARCELVWLLKTDTEHHPPTAMRRIIQVARVGIEGSLNAISRLDEVQGFSEYCPDEDPIEQMESVVQKFEDEILEWERTRTIRTDSATETGLDLDQEPMGQELVVVLEKILTEAES